MLTASPPIPNTTHLPSCPGTRPGHSILLKRGAGRGVSQTPGGRGDLSPGLGEGQLLAQQGQKAWDAGGCQAEHGTATQRCKHARSLLGREVALTRWLQFACEPRTVWGISNSSDTIIGAVGGRWHAVMDQFLSLCARHMLGGHAGEKIKMRKLEGQNMSW